MAGGMPLPVEIDSDPAFTLNQDHATPG